MTTAPDRTRSVKHDVIHHIVTNGQPTYGMPCRLVPEIFRIARQEFEPMVEIRFARHSSSSWLAPLHMVSKKSGDWRPWGDYCALNLTTVPYRYPLPNIQDFTMDLRGCTVFSMLDLEKVYHLIPIAPDDVPTTAIFAPFGLFSSPACPLALETPHKVLNAALMSSFEACRSCSPTWTTSWSPVTHLPNTFDTCASSSKCLTEHGLIINVAKCELGIPTLEFLGHLVDASSIRPLPSKVKTIT